MTHWYEFPSIKEDHRDSNQDDAAGVATAIAIQEEAWIDREIAIRRFALATAAAPHAVAAATENAQAAPPPPPPPPPPMEVDSAETFRLTPRSAGLRLTPAEEQRRRKGFSRNRRRVSRSLGPATWKRTMPRRKGFP